MRRGRALVDTRRGNFVIESLDLNPATSDRDSAIAAEHSSEDRVGAVGFFNAWPLDKSYDCIIAN